MKLAPIQLLDYHVTSLVVEAISSFDRSKPMDLDPDDLEVATGCKRLDGGKKLEWAVSMALRHEPVVGKNIPYRLGIEVVGLVSALANEDSDRVTHAVEVNGPSMLFGAVREILREATARGPHGAITIPSASFFTPPPTQPAPPSTVASKHRSAKRLK